MARKVKCVDTGDQSTSDLAYKAPNGKYFSSEENYLKWEENKNYRLKCIDKMYEVLGYSPKMIIPTYFYKKLKEYEGVGYQALYNTMLSQDKSAHWALQNKQWTGETAKVMYLMAIYNNNVMDEYKKLVAEKRATQNNNEIVDQLEVMTGLANRHVYKPKDISKWLEEED